MSQNLPAGMLWQPSESRKSGTNIVRFMAEVNRNHGLNITTYDELLRWSVNERGTFWREIWRFCGLIGDGPRGVDASDIDAMPGARYFPEARVNFAENFLRRRDDGVALVFWGEDKVRRRITHRELYDLVSRMQAGFRAAGLKPGERVAAYTPNLPETLAAMLAATSLGAIWSSCSPDFGVKGVVDRFGQIAPRFLVTADGYHYGGKTFSSLDKVVDIRKEIPSIERVIVLPYVDDKPHVAGIADAVTLADFIAPHAAAAMTFERFAFNAPVFIMYSSGTTGVPKCIVHGAGGTLLKHLEELILQCDIKRDDRLFYFTTCGWMMWNWLMSGLAAGATLLLYDGSPGYPSSNILFDYADAEGMTHFGTSAKWIDGIAKAGLKPIKTHRLSEVRTILSTGSPLAPESFDYVYASVKRDVCLSSMSGGTDIIGSFVGGNPIGPVWRGEIQAALLGMAPAAWDDDGKRLPPGEKGELVCERSFPSMPIGFWNDADGAKYHAAYFARYRNTWCHGDYVAMTEHGGMVIFGRSDATLNPGGVRIGTAEIYRQVERIDEVVESLVIGQDWENDVRIVLFVRLRDGITLDDTLRDRIRKQVRDGATPRHVPARIVQVADIPRTKSGKIVELAVRNVVHGLPVKNVEALANPEALEHFRARAELGS